MYAGGERRPNGGGGVGGEGEALRRRRLPGPGLGLSSSPGAAAAASSSYSSSSSGRGEEGGEGRGGGDKQGRRKKKQGRREAVARAIRGGLPGACWGGGGVSVVQEAGGRRWSRRERDGDASDDGSGPVAGAATATATAAPWCCVCPGGDCSLEPNPSANGKEEPGVRSLLEGNDFFSADCNPHGDAAAAAAFDSS